MMPDGQFPAGQDLPGPGRDADGMPFAEDLFSTRPSASPAEIRAAVDASMGTGPNPVPHRPGYPGIHELAEDLGLT